MKFKANFVEKPGNFQMDDCQIEKVVELSREDFCRLKITPLANQPFLAEHKGCMFSRDGVIHCLLALGQGSNDGILVDAEQYDCARLAAYIPGMRDIVNAEMDRAADFIIRQGVEKTDTGNWCVYFEELEEHLGLAVRTGSGLDSMLRAALKRRPEVAAVDMHDGCIEMSYHPEYCRQLKDDEPPGLHAKELLASHRTISLIATYEDLYHIPEAERVTCYLGDYGGHFLKYGVTEDAALAAYGKALTAVQMDSEAFQQAEGFTYRGGMIARMWNCMLDEGACLADALNCWAEDQSTVLLHEDALDCCVPMEDIAKLTDTGRKDFAGLLNAKVQEIRAGESFVEVVISGVEPEELIRFNEAHDAFMEAEWAMGDMTP